MQKLFIPILILLGLALGAAAFIFQPSPAPSGVQESPMPSPSQSSLQFEQADQVTKKGVTYTATLHTSLGDIVIELSGQTPATTNNFVFLSQQKFYDGVIFHRVIPGFMIQSGDPTGTGTGSPGYKFADEEITGNYTRGTVAMANSGPDTNGSQFFIMHADYDLPANYVIFGQVKEGLEVVDQIAATPTIQDGRENSRPQDPPIIESVTITTDE